MTLAKEIRKRIKDSGVTRIHIERKAGIGRKRLTALMDESKAMPDWERMGFIFFLDSINIKEL